MSKKIKFNIKKAALLVIDMQKYFTDKNAHAFVPDSNKIKSNILLIKKTFSENKRPIIMTQHINNKKNANMMNIWWNDLITAKNKLNKIDEDLLCKDSIIIKKAQYDAFYKTDLLKILKKKKVKQLVISGVLTHLCCETTARSAFIHGFEVFFMDDATASYNSDFHKASLLNLSHGFAIIKNTEELCTGK